MSQILKHHKNDMQHKREGNRISYLRATIWQRKLIIVLGFIIALFAGWGNAYAYADESLYDDPLYASWARDYLDGKRDAVLKSVENNLRTDRPHPYAPYIWTAIQSSLGRLEEAVATIKDSALQKGLGPYPRIYLLDKKGEYKKMLTAYPPAEADVLNDLWSLTALIFAALEEARHEDAWRYALVYQRKFPELFQTAWIAFNVVEADERVRAFCTALVKPGGRLADTNFGRFMRTILASRPLKEEVMIKAAETWLKDHPHDARAFRFLGIHLAEMDKHESAVAAFQQNLALDPFKNQWYENGLSLMRVGRERDAGILIERSALIDAKNSEDAAPLVKQRLALLLRAVDKKEEARTLLESANNQWPNNPRLLLERIELELASNSPKAAFPFARKLAEVEPDNMANQVKLLEGLRKSGENEEAWKLVRRLDKEVTQKSASYYTEAGEVLKVLGQKEELVSLWERAAREYPDSGLALRKWAESLSATGRHSEAAAKYRLSFDIEAPWTGTMTAFAAEVSTTDGLAAAALEIDALLARFTWLNVLRNTTPTQKREFSPPFLSKTESTSFKPRLVSQIGHSLSVNAVAFSPDGRFALTGGSDNAAVLWEIASGREVQRFPLGAAVRTVAFSPDGGSVLMGGENGKAELLDLKSGSRQRVFTLDPDERMPKTVYAVSFSPDGRFVMLGGRKAIAQLWDAANEKLLRGFCCSPGSIVALAFSPAVNAAVTASETTLTMWNIDSAEKLVRIDYAGDVSSVAFSDDGRFIASGSQYGEEGTATLWHAASGVKLRSFVLKGEKVLSVAVSPYGKYILSGYSDGSAVLWDIETGKQRFLLKGHSAAVTSASFSPDGKLILTGSADRTARIWDAETGTELSKLEGKSVGLPIAAFSSDNRFLVTGGQDNASHLWDMRSGGEVAHPGGHSGPVEVVLFSPDNKSLLTGGQDRSARLWNAGTTAPALAHAFSNYTGEVKRAVFSPDGRYVISIEKTLTARLCEVSTGKELRKFRGLADVDNAVAFSPDSKYLITSSDDGIVRRWSTATGSEVSRFEGHTDEIYCVAYSPDGKTILTGSLDRTARVWDAETGETRYILGDNGGGVVAVAFSPDGSMAATAAINTGIVLWDVMKGKEIRKFGSSTLFTTSLTFSPKGKFLISSGQDYILHLWDLEGNKEVNSFAGQRDGAVSSAAFTSDDLFLAVGGKDRTTRIIDTLTGRELCRLFSFQDGTWAVVDTKERYDASNAGTVEGLHWSVGDELIVLSQLKERYYEPGLLAKIMGYNKDPLRNAEAFMAPKLFPEVTLSQSDEDKTRVTINLKNRGGGIGKVRVLVNGKEIVADARGPKPEPAAKEATLSVDFSGTALIPGKENKVEVFAWNAEGYLSSRGQTLLFKAPEAKTVELPELYAIIAGVSQYSNPSMNLTFSGKDAADMAQALRISAKRLFGTEKVHLSLLSDYEGAEGAIAPSRENLEKVFIEARKSKPTDILVVYLAGHGVMTAGEEADYQYLTREARSTELADPAVRKQVSVSSTELTEWIKVIPALKQVMILDTCAAGGAAVKLVEKRSLSSDQIRSLERLKERTGFHVLMGAAADKVSLEASQYGQGLLTYSILQGIKGAALREEQFVDVQKLFQHAADGVPELAKSVGGIQRPVVAAPRGVSFDIGQVTSEDKELIPLAMVKPLVLRSNFTAMARPVDNLGLTKLVNAELRESSAVTRGGKLVYVDADELPGAYTLSGRYSKAGDTLKVEVYLFEGEREHAHFIVEGKETDLPALASQIVSKAQGALKQ